MFVGDSDQRFMVALATIKFNDPLLQAVVFLMGLP